MADIFISYINEEYEVARAVETFITAHMAAVRPETTIFIADNRSIRGGEEWLRRIRRELEQSLVVLSILSEESINRPWINFEAGAAWMSKALIPLCFGRMQKGKLPAPYNSLHAHQLREPSDQFALICDLYKYLEIDGTPTDHSYLFRLKFNEEHELRQEHRNFTSTIIGFESE